MRIGIKYFNTKEFNRNLLLSERIMGEILWNFELWLLPTSLIENLSKYRYR